MRREKIMSEILEQVHEFSRLRKEAEEIRLRKEEARAKVLHGIDQLRWIPVSERTPTEWTCVLVTVADDHGRKMVLETCYDPEVKAWSVASEQRVLAWMEMPSAYEEVTDAD